jgi:branched-chain amino acid transport system permease protein
VTVDGRLGQPPEADHPEGTARRGVLDVRDVTVNFGGLLALSSLSISVGAGSVVGVIGSNGSGKTTLLNVLSGFQQASVGEAVLDGRRIDGLEAPARARAGLARTFQSLRLFDTLSVMDNALVGAQTRLRSTYVEDTFHLIRSHREQRAEKARARELFSLFGDRLLPRQNLQVLALSYANRRRLEIVRALMAEPRLLLLDEPTAGMNPHESLELADQIPVLRQMANCSVLLVEHKMDVVSEVCSRVYALDHGVCLAEGSPHEILRNPSVAEAFLGVE